MNAVNFANCSGVVVDVWRQHGTWFDRDELRRVVEFIRAGGLETARCGTGSINRWWACTAISSLAATVTDSDADSNTFATDAHVHVKVTALNARGESQPSAAVEHVVQ